MPYSGLRKGGLLHKHSRQHATKTQCWSSCKDPPFPTPPASPPASTSTTSTASTTYPLHPPPTLLPPPRPAPRDGVDNKNARSAARRCRSRCSKLTPRTRGAKEERARDERGLNLRAHRALRLPLEALMAHAKDGSGSRLIVATSSVVPLGPTSLVSSQLSSSSSVGAAADLSSCSAMARR